MSPRHAHEAIAIRRGEQLAVSHEEAVIARPFGDEAVYIQHDRPCPRLARLELSLDVVHFIPHLGSRLDALRRNPPDPGDDGGNALKVALSESGVVDRQREDNHRVGAQCVGSG